LRCIPGIGATYPRQLASKRGEEKVESPSDDDVVEEIDVERDQNDSETNSCTESFIDL